ncbi:MAG: amidohydrolase [Cytophagales bacterium]|jgi:amidohydrolase|nr:amidohydrolase [Cytophagales bacterium]MCA6389731.1 amidohydrolase [Cytophagales bacterium]MCA6392782.1 amidohydrolase [Cytophagales bacterium]MCA6394137.1 amidohydrolase [Cytophagales bacterium]MCA6397430.1 amidohydrolase [Cytophagales bacterium]
MSLLKEIRQYSSAYANEVVSFRRHLHAHPELSYQEYNTAKFIANQLRSFGMHVQEGIAGTGVVAIIEGKNPTKRIIALRADIDALPIQEINSKDYKSINKGVMHACGHDVHTASLLGTAKILNELKGQFEGSIKLIFQPGEEKNPGGASIMIKEGVLENPAPSAILGQHVFPLLPVGKIGFREGKYMASSDEIYLRVVGKGGHGATPELTVDPVVIASHIIIALQQIISRNASPKHPTVLTFGKVTADGATNIIPDEVNIAGTFRALDERWREEGLRKIKKMAENIAEGMGGKCEVDIHHGYPCLENDPMLTRFIKQAAEEYVGKENVVDIDLTLGSEDFAYYSQVIPASFYRLGTRNESKGITSYVHTPTFDIDEDALVLAPGLMAWMAIAQLSA